MKFGEKLKSQKVPEWEQQYLDYDKLKVMITQLEESKLFLPGTTGKGTSLSIPRPTNAAGMPVEKSEFSQEQFYAFLEQEMRKIELFTKKQVKDIRKVLSEVEAQTASMGSKAFDPAYNEALRNRVETAGEDFLKLEKYVNLNFTGFHKILKKHDKRLPNPCRAFYTSRLHDQSWVRGDYSDVIVAMSRVYSALRGDEELEANDAENQSFVRSTRKYWVHTEDISTIKYNILQHLPVFLQNTMAGETDSQLVNSVYLDNTSMELYHGRLEKSPGAIALRFRWYGTGTPDVVFVERKTHRESWAGEVSVKERFIVKESQVQSLLEGTFDVAAEQGRLVKKGKSEEEIREWTELVSEVVQAINSKQLVPTMRTQYMRTAFQIPFDATVRVSLDTNLCMISERTRETMRGERWFRDPGVKVPLNEITRFPHGVLEVKLQLEDESKTPQWVVDMLHSGKLMEVHKFSKFIHGCSVLMPEDVRGVPYWIDDVTLAESIYTSGAADLLRSSTGANEYYNHLLPHDADGNIKAARQTPALPRRQLAESAGALDAESMESGGAWRHGGGAGGALSGGHVSDFLHQSYEDCTNTECCFDYGKAHLAEHITTQKVEPKLFFANERTFMSWLNMAVIMTSISIGVLAFTPKQSQAQYYAIIMMPVALLFVCYALWTYLWRSEKIKTRDANRWDDPYGPVILTLSLIIALLVQFILTLIDALEKW